jgi:hypothetical protein
VFETFAELLVRDSDTSRLDNNDLLVNDNFSVVSSRKLFGEITAAVVVDVRVAANVELLSDENSGVIVWSSVTVGLKLFVIWSSEEFFVSAGKIKRKKWN